jgi:hypothetical protein
MVCLSGGSEIGQSNSPNIHKIPIKAAAVVFVFISSF